MVAAEGRHGSNTWKSSMVTNSGKNGRMSSIFRSGHSVSTDMALVD